MLLVTIGLAAAVIVSMFPYPMTGRVELRKRLAFTLRDIGRLYGVLTVNLVMPSLSNKRPTEEQIKGFRKLTLDIRRQIADERTFLKLSAYEPPLRGDFPADRYGIILDKVENMTDLVYAMVCLQIDSSSACMPTNWKSCFRVIRCTRWIQRSSGR